MGGVRVDQLGQMRPNMMALTVGCLAPFGQRAGLGLERHVMTWARRFVQGNRQGRGGDLAVLWRRLERIVLERRMVSAEAAETDPEAGRAQLVVDELADIKARLRRLEASLEELEGADAGSAVELPPLHPVAFGDDGAIGADHYMPPASGFYALELDPSGRMYRWTGPTHEFVFDVELDRGRATLVSLHLLGGVHPSQCENLALLVDDRPVNLQIRHDAGGYVARFTVPSRPGRDFATLMFIVPRVFRPADLGQGDDWRPLGVRFVKLQKLG